MTAHYKCTNTETRDWLVIDQTGFEGLVASHVHLMQQPFAAMQRQLVKMQMDKDGVWEPTGRNLRVEKTSLALTQVLQRGGGRP
jgi:hypothetical protein